MIDENVPNIQAECADCGFIFDLKFGVDCPACHHTGVRWARLVTEQDRSARSEMRARLKDRLNEWLEDSRTRIKSSLTEFEKNSIAECEAIYALDSTGSRP